MNRHYYSSILSKIVRADEAPCSIQKLPPSEPASFKGDPRPSNYFELIWITKGTGDQFIDLQKTEIINERITILRPGQVHRLESSSEIEGYVIKFGTTFIASVEREVNSLPLVALLELFSGTKGILLTTQMKPVLVELINQMQLVLISPELLKTALLNCYIEILITHLSHQWDGSVETCQKRVTQNWRNHSCPLWRRTLRQNVELRSMHPASP